MRDTVDEHLANPADILLNSQKVARQIWILKAERLYYQLRADLRQGFQSFLEQFDLATKESQLCRVKRWFLEAERFRKNFKVGTPEYYEIRRCVYRRRLMRRNGASCGRDR